MAQQPLQIILMRQLAGYLRTPVFMVDTTGHLIFYNEAAEALLGKRFDETGPMSPDEWGTASHRLGPMGLRWPRTRSR